MTAATLPERLARLHADAEAIAVDLRLTRQAAPSGAKGPYRYRLRYVEQAAALIGRAVDGGREARRSAAAGVLAAIAAEGAVE